MNIETSHNHNLFLTEGFLPLEEDDMGVTFAGHKQHYVCDTEADIDSSWPCGTVICVTGNNKNYLMCGTGGYATIPNFSAQSHIGNAANNAANNNATNYNLVSGVLGVANGLNSANANQNTIADNLNDLATKFNTLLANLTTLGLQS